MIQKRLITRIRRKLSELIAPKEESTGAKYTIDNLYCRQLPSPQTIADIFKGAWYSSFPEKFNINAGDIDHFDFSVDPRVKWVDENLEEGLKGFRILELGPYEAYNTWQMEQLGAKEVIAIENNKINYLKCLIVKEITELNARFLHGDFINYLEHCVSNKESFDIIWASGVLYHQIDPLKLLALISKLTSKVFIHTHYYDQATISNHPYLKHSFQSDRNKIININDISTVLHFNSYQKANQEVKFSGGSQDHSYWLTKKDIFSHLEKLDFKKIKIEVDTPDHNNGPGICFLAEKGTSMRI